MSRTIRSRIYKYFRSPKVIGYRRDSQDTGTPLRKCNREASVENRTIDSWDDSPVAAYKETKNTRKSKL